MTPKELSDERALCETSSDPKYLNGHKVPIAAPFIYVFQHKGCYYNVIFTSWQGFLTVV